MGRLQYSYVYLCNSLLSRGLCKKKVTLQTKLSTGHSQRTSMITLYRSRTDNCLHPLLTASPNRNSNFLTCDIKIAILVSVVVER